MSKRQSLSREIKEEDIGTPGGSGIGASEYLAKSSWGDWWVLLFSVIFLALDILLFTKFETSWKGFAGSLLKSSIETGAGALALVIMQIWVLLVLAWIMNAKSVQYWAATLSAFVTRR